jgi:ABC-type nitrate/sulfonate/bicarbonate transport system ATPase subunit
MNSYLKVDHLSKSFARGALQNEVLHDVTLAIERGEYVSIIGHSGCGKSTLLNIIAGLLPATTGGVLLENREVNEPGPDRAVGMKQRVGLARALAMEPKVLLLDEPFGALDALTRAHLQDSVMAIHAKLGNTVLMITHDVDEAVLLSDRIVMMTNGPSAHIGELLEVPLARPRKRLSLAADSTYLRCRQRVLEFLYERHRFVEAA